MESLIIKFNLFPLMQINVLKLKKVEFLILVHLFFSGAAIYHATEYDNTSSRYFLVSSVVDYGTLNIDHYAEQTVDKSFYNGHYYSNKAIGAPLLGIPVYWLLRHLPPFSSDPPLSRKVIYIVRLLTSTLLFAISGVLLFRLSSYWGGSRKALWVVFSYGFGSIALIHATLFSGHITAGSFLFFSFFILYNISQKPKNISNLLPSRTLCGFSGIFAGLAALSDYTVIYGAAVLSVYCISAKSDWKNKFLFFAGLSFCALLLCIYNFVCFDSAFSFSYHHLALKEFNEGAKQGLLGVGLPDIKVLFYLLVFPSRGLLFISPVFLFSIVGLISLFKQRELRNEFFLITALIIGFVLINSGFYGWHGGWTYGPRYMLPAFLFLSICLSFANLDKVLFFTLFFLSFFQTGLSFISLPHIPQEIYNPVAEIMLPLLIYGYTPESLWSLFFNLKYGGIISGIIILILTVLVFMETKEPKGGEEQVSATLQTQPFLVRALFYIFALYIVFMLFYYRTPDDATVHTHRSRLLFDGGKSLGKKNLLKMAEYESDLAGEKTEIFRKGQLDEEKRAKAFSFYNQGILCGQNGDFEGALKNYKNAIEADPFFTPAYYNAGNINARAGRLNKAVKYYKQALKIEPEMAKTHNNLGIVFVRLGKLTEARKQFLEALEYKPDYEQARKNLKALTPSEGLKE